MKIRVAFTILMVIMFFNAKSQVTTLAGDYKIINIGDNTYGDYTRSLILLHEIYNGTLIDHNYAIGTITAMRGTSAAFNRLNVVNVNTSSSYNGISGAITSNDDNSAWALKTCIYSGKKYLAVDIPYADAHHNWGYYFSGWTTSTGENMKCVSYEVSGVPVNTTLISNIQDFSSNMIETHHVASLNIMGNVGIGTATPGRSLDIVGVGGSALSGTGFSVSGMYQDHTAYKGIELGYDTSGQIGIIAGASGGAPSNLAFWTYDGSGSWLERIRVNSSGNVGIGTTSPLAKLDVENGIALVNIDALAAMGGQVTISNNYGNQNGAVRLNLNNGGAVSWIKGIVTGPNTNTGSAMAFGVPAVTADGTEAMRITSDGSLAIGTTDPKGYKLAVAGNAVAESMTVDLQANWPDYVFKREYSLPPLSEVKNYIDRNRHLPGVPTAGQLAKTGINLGEMNALLMKKVEELTLYLIEKDKQDKEKEVRLQSQQKQIDELKRQITSIIALQQQKNTKGQ